MEKPFLQNTEGWEMGVSHDAPLTSAELGRLWRSLSYYTMLKCIYQHYASHLDDSYLLQIFNDGFAMLDTRIRQATELLKSEAYPLPLGFSEEDVDLKAPRLYSDLFYYYYTFTMSQIDVSNSGMNLAAAARADVREFYTKSLEATMRYFNTFCELMLQKGLYIRPPFISTSGEKDYVDRQSFLRGFLGERRPLLAVEIEQLFLGYRNNEVAAELLTGFRQVAKSEQVRSFLDRGLAIARKHIDIFTAVMEKENLPLPSHGGEAVTDSTVSPFSERLMMNHVIALSQTGIGDYATSMASSTRHDLGTAFARLIMESANYAEDGLNIMIENGWFEEPPRHIDRRDLGDKLKH
ncbi:MAG: DUF3231 family protein [Syntrophomonas sp.]